MLAPSSVSLVALWFTLKLPASVCFRDSLKTVVTKQKQKASTVSPFWQQSGERGAIISLGELFEEVRQGCRKEQKWNNTQGVLKVSSSKITVAVRQPVPLLEKEQALCTSAKSVLSFTDTADFFVLFSMFRWCIVWAEKRTDPKNAARLVVSTCNVLRHLLSTDYVPTKQ